MAFVDMHFIGWIFINDHTEKFMFYNVFNFCMRDPFLLPVFLNLELCASVDASPVPTKLLF